jgi:hypothetical protein
VIRKVDKMKCEEFIKFKEHISPQKALKNTKSISEAILNYAVKNR